MATSNTPAENNSGDTSGYEGFLLDQAKQLLGTCEQSGNRGSTARLSMATEALAYTALAAELRQRPDPAEQPGLDLASAVPAMRHSSATPVQIADQMAARRAVLPLTDWKSTAQHTADQCQLQQCTYCGCCCHGKQVDVGCRVVDAPTGMRCPDSDCGCQGTA
ncbi:hypothetical protein [Tessaracoccus sp.]